MEIKKRRNFSIVLDKLKLYNSVFIYDTNKNIFFFLKGHVIVTTLTPISTEGLTTKDVPDLIEKTRSLMSEVFKSTNQESLSLSMEKAFL